MNLEQLKIDRESSTRTTRASRMPWWTKLLVVLAVLGGAAFLFKRQLLELSDRVRLPVVKTERATMTSASAAAAVSGISANGYIVARTRAALSADTPGRIVEMNVQEGSVVKKGDVVARLYPDEYAAALKRAEAELVVALAGKTRAQADAVTAQKSLESLRSNVKAAEADRAQAEAGLRLAKLSYDRAKDLLESKVDTKDRLDRAERDLEDAHTRIEYSKARVQASKDAVAQGEAQVVSANAATSEADARIAVATAARDLAAATLEKTQVRAPFDGIVVLKDAEVGEVVSPNVQGGSTARGSVATMVDWSSLEVEVELQETSLSAAREGEPVSIYIDAWPDRSYAGHVRRIWPTANRQKATVEVRVAFEAPDPELRPEMGARVVFAGAPSEAGAKPIPQQPAILVPRSAIVRVDGKEAVFVLERDIARVRRVTLGGERSGRVVVQSGLADGEHFVDDPPASLAEGDRVRIQQ